MDSARRKGICIDGFKSMRSFDVDRLIDYYIENPDWCMERDFPDLQTLRDHFTDVWNKGVFVDKHFEGETFSDKQTYIFHHCTGKINVELNKKKSIIPMLYFANGCKMEVTCSQEENKFAPISVPIYTFGENDVKADDNEFANFKVYRNGLA